MEFLKAENGKMTLGGRPILLRSAGLGGWLLPEGYMWKLYTKCDRPRRMEALISSLCGEEYAASFWRRYYDSYITERDMEYIASQGFNSVRLPFNARHLLRPEGLNEDYARHMDECIAWCKKHGLLVILDLHAAPGGQTGKNIDDSLRDLPELFLDEGNEGELLRLWGLLAQRYRDEPAVAAFDLLNEPLAQEFSSLYPRLLPLYRRLIAEIRQHDRNHMIMLEGVHWATELDVLAELTPAEAADNIALQFHKYWSPPERESLEAHLRIAAALGVPLFDGESGENNAHWNAALFPMLERLGIGWSFWSYKKMDIPNSPATFPQPPRWEELVSYLDGGAAPREPRELFDGFLEALGRTEFHDGVACSLLRRAPVVIPAEAFDHCHILSPRQPGARLRMREPVMLLFADGHEGVPDYARYGGEPQPPSERIFARLLPGESLSYHFRSGGGRGRAQAVCAGAGGVSLSCGGITVRGAAADFLFSPGENVLMVECTGGELYLENVISRRTEDLIPPFVFCVSASGAPGDCGGGIFRKGKGKCTCTGRIRYIT